MITVDVLILINTQSSGAISVPQNKMFALTPVVVN